MPCVIGIFDHWLFDLNADPMESINLLSDEFRSYYYSKIVAEIELIMHNERARMIEAQSVPRTFSSLPEGAITNGSWTTGWCSDVDLLKNKLFYDLSLSL